MLGCLLCCAVFCAVTSNGVGSALQRFYIGGLFPFDSDDPQVRDALGIYPKLAAQLALQHISERGLLSALNFSLEMVAFGTRCEKDSAVYAYLKLMEALQGRVTAVTHFTPALEVTPPYVVLGPACNQPTYFTASLTSRYLKDIQVSYSASTPLLSDVGGFPLFYRTVPSYMEYGRTIYALMQHFGWLSVGVVHQEVSHYTRALEDLNNLLSERSNNTASVIVSLGLTSYLTRNVNIPSLARIFVATVPENMADETICAAHKSGMTGRRFQWILLGDYQENWWVPNNKSTVTNALPRCTTEEMLDGVESVLILSHNMLMLDDNLQLSREERDFWREYAGLVNATTETPFRGELATRVRPTYDAVWAVAHALRSTLSQTPSEDPNQNADTPMTLDGRNAGSSFSQGRPTTNFTRLLNAAMERTRFTGLSGNVQFNSSSHTRKQPLTYIVQMRGGRMVPIGIHSQGVDGSRRDDLNLTFFGNNLSFQGSTPPRDRPSQDPQSVQLWMVIIMISIALFGILFATVVLIVNCAYRKHKVIKASSPYLNFVIALGCMMGFLSIIFMSMESLKVHFNVKLFFFPFFCNVRLWLLTIGFTLAFGALFAKTWRIYVIFRNPWKKKRPYKDYILFCMVAVFLFFDLLLLTLWAISDPLEIVSAENLDIAAFKVQKYSYCINNRLTPDSNVSFMVWTSVIVIPKSLLLFFGIFLVVQTSRIKAKFFRDAKFTGIAIFGCVMVCGVGVPVSFFSMFLYHEDLGYIVATSTILICCYLVLSMVFIPKFILLHRYKNKIPSAVLIGLNPSFRIRRTKRVQTNCSPSHGPPMTYYSRMLRGATSSVYSRASQSSSNSSDDNNSSSDLQNRWARGEAADLAKGIGWESAFDDGDDLDGEIEVQETRLDFGGGFQYIATVGVLYRPTRVSTDTQLTMISEGDDNCSSGVEGFDRGIGLGSVRLSPGGGVRQSLGGIRPNSGGIGEDSGGVRPSPDDGIRPSPGVIRKNHGVGQRLGIVQPNSGSPNVVGENPGNVGLSSNGFGPSSAAMVNRHVLDMKTFRHMTRSCTTIMEREELEITPSPLPKSTGHHSHNTCQGVQGSFCMRTRSGSLTVIPSPLSPH